MRIAVITSWATDVAGGSGTAVFYHALINGLTSRGYDVELIAPNFDVSDYVGVTLQRLAFNTQITTDPRLQNADLVIGFDYDGYGLNPYLRPPMIASAHAVYGDVLQWEEGEIATMVKAQAFFERTMFEAADVVTIGSQYAKNRIIKLYGIDHAKIDVIPHGMIVPRWLPLVEREQRQPNDHPIILSVGKMYPRKRTDILLRAVPLLLDKYPTLEVRIVGDGLMWDKNQLAAELGIIDNVTFLGHVGGDADFAREWRQADVFCHPSSQETFGFVYLEAMTLGKPIVAVKAGAAPEVVNGSGRLAAPENPTALANELDFFLASESAREEYGGWAKIRAKRFTHDAMLDGYERAFDRAFAQRVCY
jgi:glycosyltransferase involved in cell wall biosynthesis